MEGWELTGLCRRLHFASDACDDMRVILGIEFWVCLACSSSFFQLCGSSFFLRGETG